MAYSGTTTFAVTRDQICTRAAAKLKVIDTTNGETLDAQTLADFAFTLNLVAKEAMASPGVIPWARQINTLFLQQGQATYTLGNNVQSGYLSGDNWALTSSYVTTNVATTSVATTTTLPVNSIIGFVNGMIIGVKLDTGATFWTTINGVPSGTTITLANGLPSQASTNNYIYAYSTKADRPQKVLEVYRCQNNTGLQTIDTRLDPISLQVYAQLPNKLQNGIPISWHFENKIPNAELLIWQPYDGISGYDRLNCICDVLVQDFDNAGDNPYFPIEWANYLIWKVACEMGEEFEISDSKMARLITLTNQKYNMLLDYSSELASEPLQFGLREDAWRN